MPRRPARRGAHGGRGASVQPKTAPPHTARRSWRWVRTRPASVARALSRAYSVGVRWTSRPAIATRRRARSTLRSPTWMTGSPWGRAAGGHCEAPRPFPVRAHRSELLQGAPGSARRAVHRVRHVRRGLRGRPRQSLLHGSRRGRRAGARGASRPQVSYGAAGEPPRYQGLTMRSSPGRSGTRAITPFQPGSTSPNTGL